LGLIQGKRVGQAARGAALPGLREVEIVEPHVKALREGIGYLRWSSRG